MHGYLIPFRLWNESSEGTEEKKKQTMTVIRQGGISVISVASFRARFRRNFTSRTTTYYRSSRMVLKNVGRPASKW